ncbi:MAG: YqeG family HAD IIIA-type phosphatase [Lachnospiraceae bacterium]|nr:YqeG family HAD IIIA-type phosphatase [Lachnospiraceae bacterium]
MDSRKKERLSKIGLLLVAAIWGFAFVVVKNSLDYITPAYMMAIRFTIAGVILTAVFFKRLIKSNRSTIIHGCIVGVFLFLSYLTQTIGCKYTTAGKNAFITAFYVIIVPFLLWARTKIMPTVNCFIAAVLAVIAIGLISLNGETGVNIGDILTIICAVGYAFQIDLLGKYSAMDDPRILAVLQLLITAVLSWISAPLMEGDIRKLVFNAESIAGLLYLGFLSSMVCFLLQSICQKYVKSSVSALLMSTEAVFGAVSSALVLHEVMGERTIRGFILMFAAILLALIDHSVFENLYPAETEGSAYDIDYEKMYADGMRGIIYDIDNTLVMHGAHADDRAKALFKRLHDTGYKVILLSNNKEKRVSSFKEETVYCDYIFKAGKPKVSGYERAMEMMGTDRSSTIFIGDQLFTDIWGANRAGIKTILVKPIDKKEEIQIILKRRLEAVVLYFYRQKQLEETASLRSGEMKG